MLYFLQQLLNGLHSGALYALLAFGYALTQRRSAPHQPRLRRAVRLCRPDDDPGRRVRLAGAVADAAGDRRLRHRRRPSLYAALIGHMLARSVLRAARRQLAQRHRRGDARRFDGADGACPHCRRHARFLAAADAVHAGRVRRRRRLSGDADRHPADRLRASCSPPSRSPAWRLPAPRSAAPGGRSATIRWRRRCAASTCRGSSTGRSLGGGLAAALAGIMAALLLRQYQLRHRPDLRPEDPLRHRGRRLHTPPRAARGRRRSAWPKRFGPAISRSNGGTCGCSRCWSRCWCCRPSDGVETKTA